MQTGSVLRSAVHPSELRVSYPSPCHHTPSPARCFPSATHNPGTPHTIGDPQILALTPSPDTPLGRFTAKVQHDKWPGAAWPYWGYTAGFRLAIPSTLATRGVLGASCLNFELRQGDDFSRRVKHAGRSSTLERTLRGIDGFELTLLAVQSCWTDRFESIGPA